MGIVQSQGSQDSSSGEKDGNSSYTERQTDKEEKELKIQIHKEEMVSNPETKRWHFAKQEKVSEIQTPTAGVNFTRIFSVSDEQVYPTNAPLSLVGLDDIMLDEEDGARDEVAEYCLPLMVLHFCGQTSSLNDKDSDKECEGWKLLTLKNYLRMLDKFIRQHEVVTQLTGQEEEYCAIIRLIATHRYRKKQETVEDCYQRLMSDSKRFIKIYHERGELSEALETKTYWGSRQQLLAGKVIADWVDRTNGPLDPIFGVLLQPTAGRVGPGDSGWIHDLLFDDRGHMAYHSAVHDAFGYLKVTHDVGPGYNYLNKSSYFHTDDTENCMAGQVPGISFWKKVIYEIQLKQKVLEHLRC